MCWARRDTTSRRAFFASSAGRVPGRPYFFHSLPGCAGQSGRLKWGSVGKSGELWGFFLPALKWWCELGGYLGSYLYQVDEKGRVTLPAAFRRDSEAQSFVLIQAQPDALTLYPTDTWAEVQERLRSLARSAPRSRHQLLSLTANAVEIVPDKQGRILIPDRLRQRVGIRDEAQVVGAIDKIEIWDPKRFSEVVEEMGDDFGDRLAGIFA